ncbi:hypothetical protein TREMEDRAFT_60376 [Tremella mesenterica DSM 1558]|uniref:uncharacterized protein n=1 Tax=Tremella mesenterica (strain ATCC 24925 / CBS 8224 / DSM 1558 / NBRC 9311 / NRRL Y-6157 / RJB 2259-6 / UBC 559-6) TaxID=578456 RepID=UPI0003F493C2|nr:uncharacterized protein TREMEDRAFT_60376 [Tremella mesenterica DSM 1558]EIW71448.1 hypothetical protein TREMEDRAFT_60376 [Tremella mesenterica DSM 1558]
MISFKSVSSSSLIGVAIACSGNVLISLALTVQKLAHRRQHEELISRSTTHSGTCSHTLSNSGSSETSSESDGRDTSDPCSPSPIRTEITALPVLLMSSQEPKGQTGPPAKSILLAPGPPSHPQDFSVDSQSAQKISREDTVQSSLTDERPQAQAHRTRIHIKSPTPGPDDDEGNGENEGNMEQDEQRDEEQEEQVEEGMYLRSKLWWLGMILITIGEGGNFLSYGFAPASVVAPLGTVALIANCIFAPLLLKEKFHPRELIGMGLAILGAVTVVWSSSTTNPRLNPDQLKTAISQPIFIIYTILCSLFVFILIILSRSPRWGGKLIGIDVGICALFGGYTVLSTKALSSLLSTMFLSALEYPITWVLIGVLVGTSVMQIKYLNKALMRFESKEVIPTQFVFFSLAAIIGSAVLYQEFRGLPLSRFVNFAFGIGTTFLGVYLLTTVPTSQQLSQLSSPPSPPSQLNPIENLSSPTSHPLLLPNERTPLLPSSSTTADYIPPISPRSPIPTLPTLPNITPVGTTGRIRLLSRASNRDFAPLGLNSQAGFLLLATTPPTPGMRARSMSRGKRDEEYVFPVSEMRRGSVGRTGLGL